MVPPPTPSGAHLQPHRRLLRSLPEELLPLKLRRCGSLIHARWPQTARLPGDASPHRALRRASIAALPIGASLSEPREARLTASVRVFAALLVLTEVINGPPLFPLTLRFAALPLRFAPSPLRFACGRGSRSRSPPGLPGNGPCRAPERCERSLNRCSTSLERREPTSLGGLLAYPCFCFASFRGVMAHNPESKGRPLPAAVSPVLAAQ